MSAERMLTEALLVDKFSGPLRRIAGEQDAFARKTNALNITGNVLIGAGSAALAFGAKSLQAAGKVDEFRKVVEKVRGAQEAAFAVKYVDNFDKHSSFKYFDLIDAAQRLEIQNVNLGKSFSDVADLAATSGRSLMDVVRVYDAVKGGGRVGLGLSARGGFAQFGIQPKDIFKAEGITYTPGMKLQDAMTPDQLLDGVHKVLEKTGKGGYDAVAATTTLRGAQSMIDGAMERLEKNLGTAELGNGIKAANAVAAAINGLSDVVNSHPGLTNAILVGGGGAIAVGGILKGVAAWREYKEILRGVKAMADVERAGEAAKVGVAAKEGAAVKEAGLAYDGLRGRLSAVGIAATYGTAAEGLFSSALVAGAVTVGAYAVALAGLLVVGYEIVSMFRDAGDASTAFEASTAAVNKARAEGYDLKANAGQAQGYDALPVWKQVGYTALNELSFGLASKVTGGAYDQENAGSSALTDAASRALAKKHGMAPRGVRAQQIAAEKQAAASAAEARQQAAADARAAAGAAANSYQLDPAMGFKLAQDERRVALLKEMGGHEKELKAARAGEIADLKQAAGLLDQQAAIATDAKAKYRLMDEAAEDRQKAALMGLEKKDKRDKLDKHIATLLGAGGLSEDEFLKRTGIGGRFLSQLGKGKMPVNPLKTGLMALAKRPMVINLQMGPKIFQQIRAEIEDSTVQKLIQVLEGSNSRTLYGGH